MSAPTIDPLVLARRDDPYRHDGELATCKGCGIMVRWIETEDAEGKRGRMCAAPYPLRGNWGRALEGYGEGRLDGKEPEKTGPLWVVYRGVARYWKNPPPTVEGYRVHWADCPNASDFKRTSHTD